MSLRRTLVIGTIVAVFGLEAILAACGGKEAVTPAPTMTPPAQAELAAPSGAMRQYDLIVKGDGIVGFGRGTVTFYFGAEPPEALILASSKPKHNEPALDAIGNVAYYVNAKRPLRGAVEAVPFKSIKRVLGSEFSPQTLERHVSQYNLRPLTEAEFIMASAYFLPSLGSPVVDPKCLSQHVKSYNGMRRAGVNVYPRLNGAKLQGFVVATDTVGGGYYPTTAMERDVLQLGRSCQLSPPPTNAPTK